MDIKKQVFDTMIIRYKKMQAFEQQKIELAAHMIKQCILDGGVVQLCGKEHGEEFVNELNYRAGGVACMHAFRPDDLLLRGIITVDEKKTFFEHKELADQIASFYEVHEHDLYILVSLNGKEPLLLELAKRAKKAGQHVILVCNKASFHPTMEEAISDYCDIALDIGADEHDSLVRVQGVPVGQSWTTTANVLAQMMTAEVYRDYCEAGMECPILLSANLKGADLHNNALTDPYGRRVR